MKICNNKGQAFDVFKLLIGAAIGLAILIIIISIINYLETWKIDVSKKLLAEGLDNAVQTPNGEVVVRKNLTFQKGQVFSAKSLAASAGIGGDCIELQSSSISAFSLEGGQFLELRSGILSNVFYQCFQSYLPNPDCRPYCIVSFGKELKKNP
ncbi:MAG: hypothetical protein PHD95_05695 [Candidatus ainarchaeum sp.]|nr:hypothetical protein [Candidatus ainarchaeum sp.]